GRGVPATAALHGQDRAVLALGQAIDSVDLGTVGLVAFRHVRSAGSQKGANGVFARTSVDVLAIIVQREGHERHVLATAARFEKGIEGLLPRSAVNTRGVCHQTIEIEGYAIELRRNKTGFVGHLSALPE